MPMNKRGQILLDLIAGLAGSGVKTAAVEVIRGGSSPQYRPLGGGGATVLGSGGGLSNPAARAQYFSAVNGQSSRRSALGSSWMARQGRVSPGVMRDATALWKRDNAAILKSNPALGRYAGYFAANPGAWKRVQASAGIGSSVAPARTVASAPVARQAAQQSAVARPQPTVSTALATKRQPVATVSPFAPARTAASAPVATQAAKQTQAIPAAPAVSKATPAAVKAAPVAAQAAKQTQATPAAGRPTFSDYMRGKVSYRDFMRATSGRPQLSQTQPSPVVGRPTFSDYMRGKVSYRDFMRAGRMQSSNVAGIPAAPAVSKATPAAVKAAPATAKAAPAAKPSSRVATWSPGQALPGMTMEQTKAYQSKLGKGTSGGTSIKSAQQSWTIDTYGPDKRINARTVTRPGPTRVNATMDAASRNPLVHDQLQERFMPAAAVNPGSVQASIRRYAPGGWDEHGQFLSALSDVGTKLYPGRRFVFDNVGPVSPEKSGVSRGYIREPADLNKRLAAGRARNAQEAAKQQRSPIKPATGAAMFGVNPQAAATPPAWKEQRAARRGQVDDRSTGNAYYDQLKSTVANQSAADRAKRWNEFMASQKDVTQPDDPRVAEEWAKRQTTWGQHLDSNPTLKSTGKWVQKDLNSTMATFGMPTITDEQAGDMAHDAANILQKQWGNWSQGVEGFGRRVIGALDPRTWSWVSGPITSRVYSQAHANARANSDALQAAMNRKIDADNIVTGDTGSPLVDRFTKFVSETGPRLHGEISAGAAALGGVTSAMGSMGGGIASGGAKLAPRAGQLAQRATGFLGNRASAAIGRGTASAVRGTTNAVATPFNMAAHPVRSTGHVLAEGARGIGDVARPAAQTVRALMTPGRINYSNPSAWRTAANYWGGVLKPGAKAAWNYAGSPRFFVTKQLGQAGWHALEDGNFDRASGDLGGAYAWSGGFIPGMGYELYRGISDPYAE